MSIITLSATLFLIINPLGNVKQFLSFLTIVPHSRVSFVIMRELIIALIAMLFFSFVGEWVFSLLAISEPTIFLASGIILFLSAMKILFSTNDYLPRIPGEEPFIVPIAIPMLASPALLATIMLYSRTEPYIAPMLSSIAIAWALSAVVLLSSKKLFSCVGTSGLLAFERLMGMVLVLIAMQRFMEGITLFAAMHNS